MSQETLLIRADANVAMGTGHVMRCLALAQAWQDSSGEAVFAIAEGPAALERRLAGEGFSIARITKPAGGSGDADATVSLARERGAPWLVVDGDHFDEKFLERLKYCGARVVLIDDFAARKSFPADLILNPNLNATGEPYRRAGASEGLLLGESYVMLRREFTVGSGKRVFPEKAAKILVTLGGSDPENLTPKIAGALGHLQGCEITVIAGPGYPHLRELEQTGTPNVRVLFNAGDMRGLMEQADLAVIAGGGTLWELLFMGCVVLSYARNPVQSGIIQGLAKKGAVLDLGATKDFDGPALLMAIDGLRRSRELREQMANIGRQIVDGGGAARVVQVLRERRAGD